MFGGSRDGGAVENRGGPDSSAATASIEQSWLQYFLGGETAADATSDAPDLAALKLHDAALDRALAELDIKVDVVATSGGHGLEAARRGGPAAARAAAAAWRQAAPTGCGPGRPMSTVLAVDGGWGNGDRLKVAVCKALPLLAEAQHNKNTTTLVVMGNVAGSGDAAVVATSQNPSGDVEALHVITNTRRVLLASSFDLACLRLRDRGRRGEVTMPPAAENAAGMLTAIEVLQAPAPLQGTREEPLPDLWTLHNAECAAAFRPLQDKRPDFGTDGEVADAVAIALLLKMASMMDRMLHAGGIRGMLAQSIDSLNAKSLHSLKQQLGSMVNMPDLYSRYVDLRSETPKVTPAGKEISKDAARVVGNIVSWATHGGLHAYMQSAKLVAFVPCHDAEPPHSLKGTWLVSSGMGQLDDDGTIVGKLLSDGHVRGKRFRVEWTSLESLSPRDWEREFAKQFARFYEDFQIGAEDGKLWHAIVALGCTKSDSGPTDSPSVMPMPVEFGPRAVGVFGASHVDGAAAPPTALTERLTRWTADDYPMPLARWVRLGRGQVSWGIVSHCSSTARAVAPYPALVERSVPFNKLQFDVSVALASLLVYRDAMARDPLRLTPFKNAMHNLRGVLGPCVRTGIDEQTHRVVWWTAPGVAGGVVMLLPELYVRKAFPDYTVGSEQHGPGPCAVACGFLALSTKDVVPLKVRDIEVEETEPRVFWMRESQHWSDATTGEALAAMQNAMDARGHLMRLVTREQADSPVGLSPGQELGDSSLYRLYYYSSSSNEGLPGLRVRITFANGNRAAPTLDADTDTSGESGLQTPFESFSQYQK